MNKTGKLIVGAITGTASVLGIKSYFQFRHELRSAEYRVKAISKTIDTYSGQVVYGTQGEGSPVLVIHGAGGGFDQALFTARMFGEGFQWIAPSRFGYLGTKLPEDASPEIQADMFVDLMDALNLERIPIIGISAGGPSAMQFAYRHPERCAGLVMISAISRAIVDVASNPDVMEYLVDVLLSNDWLIWLGMKLAIHKIIPPPGVPRRVISTLDEQDNLWLQRLLTYVLPVHPRRDGLVNDFSQIYKLDIFPRDQISCPALIIHAQDDPLVSIKHGRFSAEIIPNARMVEFTSGGHLLLGQHKLVKAEVESFLHRVIQDFT